MTLTLSPNQTTVDPMDEFSLDVRVVVAHASTLPGNCDTSDGCGNTCAGSASSCNSSLAVY